MMDLACKDDNECETVSLDDLFIRPVKCTQNAERNYSNWAEARFLIIGNSACSASWFCAQTIMRSKDGNLGSLGWDESCVLVDEVDKVKGETNLFLDIEQLKWQSWVRWLFFAAEEGPKDGIRESWCRRPVASSSAPIRSKIPAVNESVRMRWGKEREGSYILKPQVRQFGNGELQSILHLASSD